MTTFLTQTLQSDGDCVFLCVGVSYYFLFEAKSFKFTLNLRLWGRQETVDKHRQLLLKGNLLEVKTDRYADSVYRNLCLFNTKNMRSLI